MKKVRFFSGKCSKVPLGCSDNQTWHPGRERPSKLNTGWAQPFNIQQVSGTACGRGERKSAQSQRGLQTRLRRSAQSKPDSETVPAPRGLHEKGIDLIPINIEFHIISNRKHVTKHLFLLLSLILPVLSHEVQNCKYAEFKEGRK